MNEYDRRHLYLLRHAKSSWDDSALADHDRPLAPRGRRAAKRMATHLQDMDVVPALVLCSSSRRTRETLEQMVAAFSGVTTAIDEGLYLGAERDLAERVGRVAEATTSLLLIGHNPGLHGFAVALAGSGEQAKLDRLKQKFPTAALATLSFTGRGWGELKPGCAELLDFVVPKDLK